MTSRSTLDLHESVLCTRAYSEGRVGENHRTERRAAPSGHLGASELETRAAEAEGAKEKLLAKLDARSAA
jgi:hypothetical protein